MSLFIGNAQHTTQYGEKKKDEHLITCIKGIFNDHNTYKIFLTVTNTAKCQQQSMNTKVSLYNYMYKIST